MRLYVRFPASAEEPVYPLRGFYKIKLQFGNTEKVTLQFGRRDRSKYLTCWTAGAADVRGASLLLGFPNLSPRPIDCDCPVPLGIALASCFIVQCLHPIVLQHNPSPLLSSSMFQLLPSAIRSTAYSINKSAVPPSRRNPRASDVCSPPSTVACS